MVSPILNLKQPYNKLNDDWIVQDGNLYNWSESNCMYELAWWLLPDCPVNPLIENLRKTRYPICNDCSSLNFECTGLCKDKGYWK